MKGSNPGVVHGAHTVADAARKGEVSVPRGSAHDSRMRAVKRARPLTSSLLRTPIESSPPRNGP